MEMGADLQRDAEKSSEETPQTCVEQPWDRKFQFLEGPSEFQFSSWILMKGLYGGIVSASSNDCSS